MQIFALLLAILLSNHLLTGAALERIPIGQSFVFYEENRGQAAADVRLIYHGFVHPVTVTDSVISFNSEFGLVVSVRFGETDSQRVIRSVEPWPGIFNRFEGGPQRWLRSSPAHRRVQLTGVAPNIDLVLGQSGGKPTFTFVVAPGGDSNGAFLEAGANGSASLRVNGDWATSAGGPLSDRVFGKPRAWQDSQKGLEPVAVQFRTMSNRKVQFELGNYDRTRPLYVETDIVTIRTDSSSSPVTATATLSAIKTKGDIVYVSGSLPSATICGLSSPR